MPTSYKDQLKSPLWQKKRLEIMSRDNFTCQICLDTEETLNVHHKSYDKNVKAWEYGNDRLVTLCETCHERLTFHLKENPDDSNFNVLKIKTKAGNTVITHSGEWLTLESQGEIIIINDFCSNKLVQFLINNWLKNG